MGQAQALVTLSTTQYSHTIVMEQSVKCLTYNVEHDVIMVGVWNLAPGFPVCGLHLLQYRTLDHT